MSRLSSLLVRDRVVDVGTMERAFRRKDLEGGRLGTILLEMEALDVQTFEYYLSQAVGLPPPTANMLGAIGDEVLRELDVRDALAYGVLPAAADGEALSVLVRDPLDAGTREELEERLGRSLKQYILPDFRFEHALAELYGVRPSPRASALIVRHPAKIGRSGMTGQFAAVGGDDGAAEPRGVLLHRLGADWSEEQLHRFLSHCESRDDIVQALLGFASSHFPRAFVLAVTHGRLRGFAAKGAGVDADAVRAVTLEDSRLLRMALQKGADTVFEGLPVDLGVVELYDELGLDRPLEVASFVLRVGSRPAMLLVGDNELRPVSRTALPSVELAVRLAASAIIRLVRAQKRAHRLSGGHTAPQRLVREEPTVQTPADRALASLDDGWDFPTELDVGTTPLDGEPVVAVGDDERRLQDTDPERPAAIREASDAHLAVPDGGDDYEGEEDDGLDDLMFGEIERLVMEEHGADLDEEPRPEQHPTLLGIGGTAEGEAGAGRAADEAAQAEGELGAVGDAREAPDAVPAAEEEFAGPVALVEALSSGNEKLAVRARAGLLLGDEAVLDVFTQRFPGPIETRPEALRDDQAIDRMGPFFPVVRELGQRFLEPLWALTRAEDRERRLFATVCLRDVRHADNLGPLTERLFDSDPAIRREAARVTRTYDDVQGYAGILQRVRRALEEGERARRVAAAEAAAALGDAEAVPALLDSLEASDPRVVEAARDALERLTFQALPDARRWRKWYKKHGRKSRADWLVASVTHKDPRVRERVLETVRGIPGADLDFDPAGGRRELKRATADLAAYFKSSGVPRL